MIADDDGAGSNPSGIIKVIGIGQSLRGDDAAGLLAVRLWEQIYPLQASHPNIQVEVSELPGIALLDLLKGFRVAILVDAVRSGSTPGIIHQLSEDQLVSYAAGSGSAHGWSVAETLALGQQLFPSQMPLILLLIGIEAGQLGLGEKLSPEVEACLPAVADLVEQHVTAALAQL